ncbi:MAG: hypothetical protein HYZ27_01980 [Deltaproteobacteria bacterium]|nr:hypothetical protein [Deltaproteobacteria bacterium]
MAEKKFGTVIERRDLSAILMLFRLSPEPGGKFPAYKAGQYIALRRDDCKLTKRIKEADGSLRYEPDIGPDGAQRIGQVAHSYSIASGPHETAERGWLEFYVVLELDTQRRAGRLTESLFRLDAKGDNRMGYVDRIVGDFTLDSRAQGAKSVLMVGTGTGLAPFVSMVKDLHHRGARDGVRYTLIHTNRTREELAYHDELCAMEKAGRFDFAYVASVSRPSSHDSADAQLGLGRANNLLRSIVGMPLKEEEALSEARAQGRDVAAATQALERAVKPRLPAHLTRAALQARLAPTDTVVLTCGNPSLMADIAAIAAAQKMRFEKEDW